MSKAKFDSRQFKPTGQLRADAAQVVFQILENGRSAREVLPIVQQRYKEQDKAWIQEMVYGVLRQLPALQLWLRALLEKPLKNRYKIVEHVIMVGFYQLAFTRVSSHAAVSETVSAASALSADSLKGLVNAILRNFERQALASTPIDDPIVSSGLPKWLYKRLDKAYPSQLASIIDNMSGKAPIWLRVNSRRVSASDYAAQLREHDIGFTLSDDHPDGIILEKSQDVTLLPGFTQGLFAVQDGAAQLAAAYLGAEPGERVLDCCAAPGGKTCHILESQPEVDECVALDVDASRMSKVEENLSRLGLQATLQVGDATQTSSWWDGKLFDRILLDAPCSATGIVRRHPDIKWLRKGADIDKLAELQSQILDSMWSILKKGGTLLYATCSILPEENTQQVQQFLARTPDASLVNITPDETSDHPGRQILPGEGQMDGFYYARLLKS